MIDCCAINKQHEPISTTKVAPAQGRVQCHRCIDFFLELSIKVSLSYVCTSRSCVSLNDHAPCYAWLDAAFVGSPLGSRKSSSKRQQQQQLGDLLTSMRSCAVVTGDSASSLTDSWRWLPWDYWLAPSQPEETTTWRWGARWNRPISARASPLPYNGNSHCCWNIKATIATVGKRNRLETTARPINASTHIIITHSTMIMMCCALTRHQGDGAIFTDNENLSFQSHQYVLNLFWGF